MTDWIIKNMLEWSTDYFRDKQIENPRLDAELLLCHLLKIRRLDLYLLFDRPLVETELAAFKQLVKRRAANEPVAYITGVKEFHSLEFKVTPDVLIPRPETELLVDTVLDWAKKNDLSQKNISGFEVGLGSGAISVALLKNLPELKMTAVDISPAAIQVATENAKTHGVDARLSILNNDFLTLDLRPSTFDFIISNPPYVTTAEIQTLADDVKKFEPTLALEAGSDGLKFYEPLAAFAKVSLRAGGFLAVEIGETQGEAVQNIFLKNGFLQVSVKKDYSGRARIVTGIING